MNTEELFESSGGGAPLFFNKNTPVGGSVTGTVVKSEPVQARDYEDNTLKFWDDGSKMMQLVVTLQTSIRDRSIEDDDGQRRLFLRWWGSDRKNLEQAIYATGDKYLKDGATLTATFVGFGEQKDRKLNPPKLFEFQYVSPPSATEQMMSKPATTNGQATIPAQYTPPRYQPEPQPTLIQDASATQAAAQHVAAAPATPSPTGGDRRALVAQIRDLAAEGLDAATIAEIVPGITHKAIEAILAIKV